MKVALLGTGFGQAHAAVYAQRSDVDEVVVFGRTPEKLAQIRDDFGFATSTDLDAVLMTLRWIWWTSACPPGCTRRSRCGP